MLHNITVSCEEDKARMIQRNEKKEKRQRFKVQLEKKLFYQTIAEVCDAAASQVSCAEVSSRIFAAQANNTTTDQTYS